jgi:hypothetical protein
LSPQTSRNIPHDIPHWQFAYGFQQLAAFSQARLAGCLRDICREVPKTSRIYEYTNVFNQL